MRTAGAILGCIFAALTSVDPAARADTKVEPALLKEAQGKPFQRVIILTRPDPGAISGGDSLSKPAGYISTKLGTDATNVRQIGKLSAVVVEVTPQGIEKLKEDPNIAKVTRDVPMPATLMDSVPEIGAPALHGAGYKGAHTSVAVLDTGVDASHPALKNSIVAEACFSTTESQVYKVSSLCPNHLDMSLKQGAASGCPGDVEGCEHGTHVAGIVAGHDMSLEGKLFSGVAPAAGVVAVQVFTLFEGEDQCGGKHRCVMSFTSDQLRALDWAYKNRVQYRIAAVNMSLGSGYFDQACDSASALTESIERLRAKGVPTVVAAGNDGYYDAVTEPACISSAFAIAALTKDGKFDAEYSNMSSLVRLAAPGTGIVSTVFDKKYAKLSGTSMAAPHVAGAFALLREKYPGFSVKSLAEKLNTDNSTAENPKTGAVVKVLEVAPLQEAPPAAAILKSPVVDEKGTPVPTGTAGGARPAEVAAPVSESLIVKTPSNPDADVAAELRSRVEGVEGVTMEIKQIGRDAYRVDISPKDPSSPGREVAERTGKAVERLRSMDGVKVFDNRLSVPKVFR